MDYEQGIKRDFWRNFGIIAGVDGAWGFGAAFVQQVAILPAFLEQLGASAFLIGLLPAVSSLCLFAPQLLAAHLTRHLPVKKVFFTLSHYPGTMALLLLAYLTMRHGATHPSLVLGSTFAWVVLFGLSISFAMPMWVNLMAKLFPAVMRGRSFGYVRLLNSIFGALGSLCAAKILRSFAFPNNFAALFLLAGLILSGCVTSFLWLREPPRANAEARGTGAFLRDVGKILTESSAFVWLLAARFIGTFSMMAAAFYTVAGLTRFELSSAAAGTFGATLLAAQVIGALVGGRLGDRLGFKLLLVLASMADAGASALAILAPSVTWYYMVFLLLGLRSSFVVIGGHNLTIEFCPTDDKTTFVALSSTVLCPAYVLGPFLGGLLAKYHPAGYNAVFAAAILCSLAALVLTILKVTEPRKMAGPPAP